MPDQNAPAQLLAAAFAALNSGQLAQAGELCKRVLARHPELPQAHFLVGLVALEGQDRRTAFQAFASVTKLAPEHAAAWAQLARLLLSDGQFARADEALAVAVRCHSDDPIVLDLLGSLFSLTGEYQRASGLFERAVARAPKQTGFLLNLANNHIYHGRIDAGLALLERLLAIAPDSPQAHWVLANTRRAANTEHIEQMQALLAKTHHQRARAFFYYAIGKSCEDLGDFSAAGAAFVAGASARRTTVVYDEAAEIALFQRLTTAFNGRWLSTQAPGTAQEGPIFVLGQPRTGTTLVERIISAHSSVESAGELQQFPLAVRRLSGHQAPQRYSAALIDAALTVKPAALGAAYLETAARARGTAPLFVDKLPQNYLLLPLILAALPQARIVHLVRDPADACVASFKQLFADAYLHSYEPGEMARHHLRYRQLMDHWRAEFPERFIELHYESLARDLEPNARQLLAALGLPWEPACLRFYEQPSAVSTASAVQVREPAHSRSIGQWRRYQDALAPLFDALAQGPVNAQQDRA